MKTILLVDDDRQVLRIFGVALRQGGYNVIEADSGINGLESARKHLPDLILSDINMAGGDGSTLLREIRADPELRSKPVVLMTGRPDLVSPRKGMDEGADDFLLKPVSFEALRNCIEARLNRASINWRVENRMLAQLRNSVPPHLPHEFFTPLAGIIGLMEILCTDFPQLVPKEVRDINKDVHQSALRLYRTLRNYLMILDLPNAMAGVPSPLPIREVEKFIQTGAEEALRRNNRREDVTIRLKPCAILVSSRDFSLIVEELVDNACKFSRPGTPVTVELNSDGRLMVTDQGRGLTSAEIVQIEAFRQFDRKCQEQQGLGLGLVLVQKLSANCGAKFFMNSRPGEGAQVEITFSLSKTV
jgi:CheY-like chemotaxis protein